MLQKCLAQSAVCAKREPLQDELFRELVEDTELDVITLPVSRLPSPYEHHNLTWITSLDSISLPPRSKGRRQGDPVSPQNTRAQM